MSNILFNLAQAYLNQGVPSIAPLFQPVSSPPPIIPPTADPGLTPEQLLLLQQQQTPQTTGRDDDDKTGFGLFGLLDPNTEQTVVREVYDEEEGDFVPTELKVYRNVRTGALQTYEGKNVDGLLTSVPTGGAFGIFEGIFGPKPIGGYPSGKIRGRYDTIADIFSDKKNTIPTVTKARQGLINVGSRVAEDFEGGGEFSTSATPKKLKPTGAGGQSPGPKPSQRGGTPVGTSDQGFTDSGRYAGL